MFEQSLIINSTTKKPWNFVASIGAELLIITFAVIIPLIYYDHLPAFHWKDIAIGPPPSPPPVQQISTRASESRSSSASRGPHRRFVWTPNTPGPSTQTTSIDIGADAPPIIAPGGIGGSNNMLGHFIPNIVTPPPPSPKPAPAPTQSPSAPIRVGGDVQMAKLIRKVTPPYPPLARSARISGTVRLIGTIAKDGTIQNLQLVSGHPLLALAAMEAVQQWVYQPTLLNSVPVEVIAPIEVTFTLAQ